jgi:hypothetical protein
MQAALSSAGRRALNSAADRDTLPTLHSNRFMTSPNTAPQRDPISQTEDFSLVLGGPLFQLWRRLHLSDDALLLARRRGLLISLFCWLPLLAISAFEGRLLRGTATVPFWFDIEVHARFLVALPLLIAAELVVHERILPALRQFKERALVPRDAIPEFDAAVASASRLRNSVPAEVSLIALVYIGGILIVWRHFIALDASTWYATAAASGSKLSFAGLWYGYVSLPVFQFLLVRWYFRLFIWARLLRRISRIQLDIIPTHPDHAGGLGFLSAAGTALVPIAVAHGALLAGQLADRILHLGAKLPDFKAEIALVVLFMLVLMLGPLLVFSPQLASAKRKGRREYDALAQRYVREFDVKWLRGGAPAEEAFVGSGDIQSLADLGNSLEVVRTMRAAPITKNSLMELGVATLLPIAPLLLTMVPLDVLLKTLLGMLI